MENEFARTDIASNLKRLSREQEALAKKIERYHLAEDSQALDALTAETHAWLQRASDSIRKP